ncbi:MAG: radical SAM protein [Kiritimatiellae bacterium]|nr:radical SAM protein [Kiritimatiellia bacterium]
MKSDGKFRVGLASVPFLPNFCRSQRWPVVNRTLAMRYPDWLAYAGGVLEKEEGVEVELRDFIAEGAEREAVAKWCGEWKPDLLVIDATTPSIYSDEEIARQCKSASPGTHVAMVGPHVSVYPEETLKEAAGGVDSVAVGEYDYTVRDLARALAGGDGLEGVEGLVWRDGDGAAHRNVRRAPIEDLDALPFPSWRFLDVRKYRNNTYLYPFLDQISGRGCPNGCIFCQWPQVMHGRRYRYCSPERVVAEMEEDFGRYGIREIFFEDDTLTTNRKRLREICELILKGRRKMAWSCNSRVDWADLDLMKLMKAAGCRMLLIGPESGNQGILDRVHKGITLEQARTFVKTARKAGLKTHSCWVVGLPGETRETMEETIRFARELDTDTIQASAVMPQVGTELFQMATANGWLKMKDWADYAMHGEQTAVMEYPDLKQGEMNAAVNRLLKGYYFRPRVMLRLLGQSIGRPSLLASYARGFVGFVGYLRKRAGGVEGGGK